ncbi:hypothetical protein OG206_05535 [Streptomyces sp. NBC_01341]|uniref:hypothetical protein n=1 Tax=Streptomyces sp. NBC_01341 TaxID=2903831 RepID=UPI002E110ED2|nr:hypothetical protein OG206_05535 [Streptomyces sp. NBC_01341]
MTFVEDVLNGRASLDDIDTYRDEWDESGDDGVDYHTFLGLLWPEYAMYAEDDDVLAHVIEARRSGQNLRSYLSSKTDMSPTIFELRLLAERYAKEWEAIQE